MIEYEINTLTRKLLFHISLGRTIGHFPFGFGIYYDSSSSETGVYDLGTKYDNYQSIEYNSEEDKYILTNIYGETIIFNKLTGAYTVNDVQYNYLNLLDCTYLSVDETFYYLKDAKGNYIKRRKTDGLIIEYKGKDGSNYNLRNENSEYKEYVSINNPSTRGEYNYSRIILKSDCVVIYEQTKFVESIELTFNEGKISGYKVYKNSALKLVEDYSFSYGSVNTSITQRYTYARIIDNIRKKQMDIRNYTYSFKTTIIIKDTEDASLQSTITFQSNYINNEKCDNTTITYDDEYRINHRYIIHVSFQSIKKR